ncbi:MAG: immunoglobulin domain-containing protein [Oscillospiraceae bacterium]|jgi:hypothetical protein|nr:immunoglobulin domain-containing protein [Oscillospiraceae bacterium]
MENANLFPLSRNKYYFGKLLTPRDMEAEQRYFNNKRRLLNALITGPGVAVGLGVMKLDDVRVAVESGFALDGAGREVVLDKPVIARLSELDGFGDDYGMAKRVYLCADYAETLCEEARSLADAPLEENRFGRVEETARLYLRYEEPDARETGVLAESGESLEQALERGALWRLYLARIHLARWEDAYEIESIENLPFGQKVRLPAAPEAGQAPLPERPRVPAPPEEPAPPPQPARVFGRATVDVAEGARHGSLHYSGDIVHGLGMVGVYVTLGLQTDSGAVFGDPSVFCERGYEWAVKTNEENGSFTIGVRVTAEPADRVLRFIWVAETDPAWAEAAPLSPSILITPGSVRLAPRESVQFTAETRALPGADVVWYAGEQDSGGVTKEGYYVAPDREGVYTVHAVSASVPEVSGTAYIVVKPPL